MKVMAKRHLLALLVALGALLLQACSPADDKSSAQQPATDTVVHEAATAPGAADDIVARGEQVYLGNCAACHQPTGVGLAGAFPPLAGSDFLAGDRKAILSTVLFGRSDPITVNGSDYNGVMPSMGYLTNEDLAAVLTYVFTAWGNTGSAVSVEEVAAMRDRIGARSVETSKSRVMGTNWLSPVRIGRLSTS